MYGILIICDDDYTLLSLKYTCILFFDATKDIDDNNASTHSHHGGFSDHDDDDDCDDFLMTIMFF